ncbi:MAG: ribonuclease HII [Verrucomicrobia bacterium]|nr:ribonuclease HII [Verrucomicrobiota bacterium]
MVYRFPVGIDEAGRGPLAGPVVAAACFLPFISEIKGIKDSKKLTPLQRERVAKALLEDETVKVGVGMASPEEIDEINILQASLLAMRRAVDALPERPDFLFIDGNVPLAIDIPLQTVVQGDQKIRSIGAASIVAKVKRDEIMKEMHSLYPVYGFDKHKGYPTAYHFARLLEHGPSPIHRKSFTLTKRVNKFESVFSYG